MTPEPELPIEIFQNLERLAKQGKHTNPTERWILMKCYENYRTKRELADLKGVSVQAMNGPVNRLVTLNLLDAAMKHGGSTYFKCRFDISMITDNSYRFEIRKQPLTFEQLMFYYYYNEIDRQSQFITVALAYLHHRSVNRSQNVATPGPTGAEVKSFVLSMCDQLDDWVANVRVLTEQRLFAQTPDVHEIYGPVEGELYADMMARFCDLLPTWWNDKWIGTKGVKLVAPKEQAKEGRKKYNDRYELRLEPEE